MRNLLTLLALLLLFASVAQADDDPRFRRTTPRGSFGRDESVLLIGVPGGRAWGIESSLMPVASQPGALSAVLEVRDPSVREAFVRVAWYDRATGRPRQFAIVDARAVRIGETATLEIPLDPPVGAVAYRIRVLARLRRPDALSAPDAIRVSLARTTGRLSGYPPTRLLPPGER